ncbi:MAG: DMT family transporter [Pseudomonadota bacterium]
MTNNTKNFLSLILLASLWGPSFLFIKVAITHIPPIALTAFRVGLGSLMLYALLQFKNIKLPNLKPIWKHFSIAALLQSAVPFTLFSIGEKTIDSSLAAIICGSAPLFTLVLAHFTTHDDKFTKTKLIGASAGFFGLFILIAPALFKAEATIIGMLEVMIGALCYAGGFVYVKKFINLSKLEPLTVPTLQLFFSFLFLLPTSLIFEDLSGIKDASLPAILSAFSLAFFGSAVAFTVYYKILKATSATYLSMVNYIVPVFGAVLGVIILGEKLAWNSYVGCALILVGVMIANGIIRFPTTRQKINLPL